MHLLWSSKSARWDSAFLPAQARYPHEHSASSPRTLLKFFWGPLDRKNRYHLTFSGKLGVSRSRHGRFALTQSRPMSQAAFGEVSHRETIVSTT